MNNNSFLRFMVFIMMTITCITLSATSYKILYINTQSVRIGNNVLKVGDSFSDKDLKSIEWVSDKQVIKARNEDTKRTRIFTKWNVKGVESPSLKDYLTKRKSLMTRSISRTVELLDTICFDISDISNNSMKYISVWKDGDYRVRTSLPVSKDGNCLYLTRNIFGHHEPKQTRIGILQYNLKTDSNPDTLGLLSIQILPLQLP